MMNNCAHVLKTGKNKDKSCGKPVPTESPLPYCSRHKPETTPQFSDALESMQYKFIHLQTSQENKSIILRRFRYLETLNSTSTEYQKNLNWLRHALNFPYDKMINLPKEIKLDASNQVISKYVSSVYDKINKFIYGMDDVKEELMAYVCKRISNPDGKDNILCLHGANGVGKTRLAHGLAEALDLPIKTINLGSVNDVSYFTGHGFTYVDSEPGRIVQILNEMQCKNGIIYFDELDKVHQTDKGQAIYAFLTHLIDPTQNSKFQDVYLSGLELDVSKIFFVFSFNDENAIDATVKDRLKIIKIEEPSKKDKIHIAEQFIIPEICKNINYDFPLDLKVIEKVVNQDKTKSGLRGIKRVLEDILGKLNVLRMLDQISQEKLSFYNVSNETIIDNIINKHANIGKDRNFISMYC